MLLSAGRVVTVELLQPGQSRWIVIPPNKFSNKPETGITSLSFATPASVIWVPASGVTQAGQAVVFRFRARADEVRLLRKMTTPIAETASKNGPNSGSGITPTWKSATTGK